MQVGSKGLLQLNLVIPQSTSIAFKVVVKDEDTGEVIDYSGATPRMRIKPETRSPIVLDDCCSVTAEEISIFLPATKTATLPIGKHPWDLMVEVSSLQVDRICYGTASVVDTYAMDGE